MKINISGSMIVTSDAAVAVEDICVGVRVMSDCRIRSSDTCYCAPSIRKVIEGLTSTVQLVARRTYFDWPTTLSSLLPLCYYLPSNPLVSVSFVRAELKAHDTLQYAECEIEKDKRQRVSPCAYVIASARFSAPLKANFPSYAYLGSCLKLQLRLTSCISDI